ncbi:bola-like protein [Gymnopilus junonius]|uniref:Bola-like protein n=1 Tax=Gymnopilus junonius TaxID=109634 RepID=A0A9P5TL02_GYMJU|nr:bola-like protein [Gymnopilus junonius]
MLAARYTRSIRLFSRSLSDMNATSAPGPVENSIRKKLTSLLHPTSLSITNDSWQHRHHTAMREQGSNGETHFTVHVVSNAFENKSSMQRHRIIYSALSEEFSQGLHALSLKTKTESESAAAAVV